MTSTIGPIPTLQQKSHQHFSLLVRSFLACDAVMLMFLTFGYISPTHPEQRPTTDGVLDVAPVAAVRDVGKASPFRVPTDETRPFGRQPDVVYTRSQAGTVTPRPVETPSASVVPVTDSVVPPSTTAVALPLGVS